MFFLFVFCIKVFVKRLSKIFLVLPFLKNTISSEKGVSNLVINVKSTELV